MEGNRVWHVLSVLGSLSLEMELTRERERVPTETETASWQQNGSCIQATGKAAGCRQQSELALLRDLHSAAAGPVVPTAGR